MRDLSITDESVNMLGGGSPARIPEMERFFKSQMENLLGQEGQFERLVGNYAGPQGSTEFVTALADLFQSEYGWNIGPENIAVTNGSQMAFSLLFRLLAGKFPDGSHKRVLLPVCPEYIGYNDTGEPYPFFTTRCPIINQISEHSYNYQIDFKNLEITEDISAICVSRPTNPTGNVISDNEVRKLAKVAKENRIPLIIDGAYGFPFPGIIYTDDQPYWDENVVLVLSLSKIGAPGVRTGIVIANPELIDALTCVNAAATLATSNVGSTLILESVKNRQILNLSREVIRPYYKDLANRAVDIIETEFHDTPYMLHTVDGAFFVWLWFPGLPIPSIELYSRIKASGTIVVPGDFFFPGLPEDDSWKHRHECLRVSYAGTQESVQAGIKTIAEEVKKAYYELPAQARLFG